MQTHLQVVFTEYDAPRILVLGCGNSKLSEVIYNNGHADITNVDFSGVVVDDMKKRYKTCEGMMCTSSCQPVAPRRRYPPHACHVAAVYVCNITDLSLFPENSFDIVIDKGASGHRRRDCTFTPHLPRAGCLDCVFAILDGARQAIKACHEVFRVLAPKGHYLMYSCASQGRTVMCGRQVC